MLIKEENWYQDEMFTPDGVSLTFRCWQPALFDWYPPLLLLHDVGSNLLLWDEFGKELATTGKTRVEALDQRGHGFSETPSIGYNAAQFLADLECFCDWSELSTSYPIVIAQGWSAYTALAYVAKFATNNKFKVTGLVLLTPAMANLDPEAVIEPSFNQTQLLNSFKQIDYLSLAENVYCPVLLVFSEQSKNMNLAQFMGKFSNSTKAEIIVMPETVHNMMLQRPKELAELIINYFADYKPNY